MIYNRYIPGTNGVYTRQRIDIPSQTKRTEDHTLPKQEVTDQKTCFANKNRAAIDLGDVLLLCIAVLLLLEADGEDSLSILIAIIAFMFMQ